MNKIQKIVVSVWIISSFIYWIISLDKSSYDSFLQWLKEAPLGLLYILLIFGVPALILLIVWKDKKAKNV